MPAPVGQCGLHVPDLWTRIKPMHHLTPVKGPKSYTETELQKVEAAGVNGSPLRRMINFLILGRRSKTLIDELLETRSSSHLAMVLVAHIIEEYICDNVT